MGYLKPVSFSKSILIGRLILSFLILNTSFVHAQNNSLISFTKDNSKSNSSVDVFDINDEQLNEIYQSRKQELSINLNDETIEFEQYEIRNKVFKVVDQNGIELPGLKEIICYKSKDKNKNALLVIQDNDLVYSARKDGEYYQIRKHPEGFVGAWTNLAESEKSNGGHFCGDPSPTNNSQGLTNSINPISSDDKLEPFDLRNPIGVNPDYDPVKSSNGNCIPLAYDISYDIYLEFGGDLDQTYIWFMSMFQHVAEIYAIHDVCLSITELKIFTDANSDPLINFTEVNYDMRDEYENYLGVPDGDVNSNGDLDAVFGSNSMGPTGTSARQYVCKLRVPVEPGVFFTTGISNLGQKIYYLTFGIPPYVCGSIYPTLGSSFGGSINAFRWLNLPSEITTDSIIFVNTAFYEGITTVAHELGHTFGVYHEHSTILDILTCGYESAAYPIACCPVIAANLINYTEPLNNCDDHPDSAVGGIMSYCHQYDHNLGFGLRADVLIDRYNEFLATAWAPGANESWCQFYQIEEPANEPLYSDDCNNFVSGPIPFTYYIDNFNHSASITSNLPLGNCGWLNMTEDTWLGRIPILPNVDVEIETYLNATVNLEVYSGSCSSLTFIFCDQISANQGVTNISLTNVPTNQPLYFRLSPITSGEAISVAMHLSYPDGVPIATNDSCSDAIYLEPSENCGFSLNSTNGLTMSNDGNSGCNNTFESGDGISSLDYDEWFVTTAPQSGKLNFQTTIDYLTSFTPPYDLRITNFEALIEVYTGDCNNLNYVDCSWHDFDTNLSYTRPDIEVSNLTPGENVYFRLKLAYSGPTVRTGLILVCLSEGLYFPEGDLFDEALTIEVQQDECHETILSSFRTARSEVYFPVNQSSIPLSIDPDHDIWYKFQCPMSSQFRVNIQRDDTFIPHFQIVVYKKETPVGDSNGFTLIDSWSPYYYSSGEDSYNGQDFSNSTVEFDPTDEIYIQVLLEGYGTAAEAAKVYDFELCVYDVSPCRNAMYLTEPILQTYGVKEFYSAQTIESVSDVIVGNVLYSAEEFIDLLPGFEVRDENIFNAVIENCPHDNEGNQCEDIINLNVIYPYQLGHESVVTVQSEFSSNSTWSYKWYSFEARVDGTLEVSSESTLIALLIFHYSSSELNCDLEDYDNLLTDGFDNLGNDLSVTMNEGDQVIIRWRNYSDSPPFEFDVKWTCANIDECSF